ncbi:MAG: leucine--tRNA ligase [Candidatus Micrarchaeota archaeon]|nr:leucine--tRNA ligase [Candidatus Micrarchaeota archaeon]
MDYKEITAKWQKAWKEAKVYEVEPNEREGMLVTAAFPYVNAPQHMGHLRTYGSADTYARYKRMRGLNVLYPMGFHATGTPILAFAKRIANNDQDLIGEMRRHYHIPEEDIRRMVDPLFIANYFVNEMEGGMRLAGYGIDWRRKFVSIEPMFSKMVEWQFLMLKEKGYITQGRHPVGWCTNENNAVGQHDTKHDVQPEIERITAVKFRDPESGIFFPCATYRPETIYGVTNIFVNEGLDYAIAKIGDERLYLSKDAAKMLEYQFGIQIEKEIKGRDLLGKRAVNPINKEEVVVLPGFFVKSDVGTGVVMSVPSHAPFDYVALERLKAKGYPVPKMEYRKLIEIEPLGNMTIGRSLSDVATGQTKPLHPEIPALAYLEILNTNPDAIDDMIEFATKLAYREESHWGKMMVGKYAGSTEPEARDRIKADLIASGDAFDIYTISNSEPVICRCGTRVIVKMVENQWFINYGDPEWKEEVRNALKGMRIFPEKYRLTFEKVVEWIDVRSAEREQGLGTRFPFNREHIIESLSDSTIYMSLYTYSHLLKEAKVQPEQLKPEFFDHVYLGKGSQDEVAASTGIDSMLVKRCRESYDYWYGNTARFSGPDLIWNHLTMYIFNHVALFGREKWPKEIVTNGMVTYEGEKMSKSLGNIVPLKEGLERHGVDPLRFVLIAGADLDTETDFSVEAIGSVTSRNAFLAKAIESLSTMRSKELSHMDYWLYSKLNSKIKRVTELMDSISLKNAYTDAYFNSVAELKLYMERGGSNEIVVRDFLESVVLMMAPIMPHIAEEFWHALGKQSFVVGERWPQFSEQMINPEEEAIEDMISNTINDIMQGIALSGKIDANKGKKVSEVRLIVADDWKLKAYNALAAAKSMQAAMQDKSVGEIGKEELAKFLGQFAKRMQSLTPMKDIGSASVIAGFKDASQYISEKVGAQVVVEGEKESKSQRAARALPDKPSIDISWK